jgi:hypothetical protein
MARSNPDVARPVPVGVKIQGHYQMRSVVVMWLPLLTIVLTVAICFGVVSFMIRESKPQS